MDKFTAQLSSAAPRWSAGLLSNAGIGDAAGARSASTLSTQASVGIRRRPAAERQDPGRDTPPLEMTVSADLQQLLAIQARPAAAPVRHARRVGASPADDGGTSRALADGVDLLADHLKEARRWLNTPDMEKRLGDRGLTIDEVESQLQRQAGYVTRTLESEAAQGGVVFPMVPSAHQLFSRAVLDADERQRDRAEAGAAVTASATVTPPVDLASTQAPDLHVDLVRRNGALRSLYAFRENYVMALPQIGQRRLQPLWHFVQGNIYFRTEDHAASVFPCAISVSGGTEGHPLTATYPQPPGERTSVRQPFVGTHPVVVARSPDSAAVRISSDGLTWRTTRFYSDSVVEAAKLEVWRDIMNSGNEVYRRVLENSLWA